MNTHDIAEFLDGELLGSGSVEIAGIASLESAGPGDISFVEKSEARVRSKASCLIVSFDYTSDNEQILIRTHDPKLAFALIAGKLKKKISSYSGRNNSVIDSSAEVLTTEIGNFVTIGENSYIAEESAIGDCSRIGRNVKIGKAAIVHSNCVIYDDVEIGANCIIHSGTVIGADGFGYVKDSEGNYQQFPQIGKVVIENGVEIGANSCIDRGSLGETRIGEGTKIDNLVQIAHNVKIGKRVVIAAQTGISGSTIIEDDCVIGGQVGMGDHARVKTGAIIGSQAGVLPGKIVRPGVWWGTPIQPLDEYKRQNAHLKGLSRLKEELKLIRQKIDELTAGIKKS